MAIYVPDSPCPLCLSPVGEKSEQLIGFTFLGSRHHLIQQVDDCMVHRVCLNTWKDRDEFIVAWNFEGKSYGKLVLTKDGEVEYARSPIWCVLGGELAYIVLVPFFWTFETVSKIWERFRAPLACPKKYPCQFCGTSLISASTRQCLKCGMDWHDPDNVFCQFSTPADPDSI